MRPPWDHRRGIAHPATAGDVGRTLAEHPDTNAVILITPTEYGTGADVAGIARHCRARRIPPVIDEAWGAHLPFHPELPTPAIRGRHVKPPAALTTNPQSSMNRQNGCPAGSMQTRTSSCGW